MLLLLLVAGCTAQTGPAPETAAEGRGQEQSPGTVSQPASAPGPDKPLSLIISPDSGVPGAVVTARLRVLEPERIARRNADGSFLGWVCFHKCGGGGASTGLTFKQASDDPLLFTAAFTLPLVLDRNTAFTAEGKALAAPEFAPVAAGEYQIHAACVLDQTGGCVNRSEVSTAFRLSAGLDTVAWRELPEAKATPVQRLGLLSTTSRSPQPGSQRSVECVAGNLAPQSGEAPPRLHITDDAGRSLPPIPFRAGGPLFGRHGYAGCSAVSLDPVQIDTYYVAEAPHAGGTEPGPFVQPYFTRDRGATWAPVPAPEGFEARKSFVGFTLTEDGVTAWFSRASLEDRPVAGEQIRGSLSRDGGQNWTTIGPACPDAPETCRWQLRDRPPVLRSGLIRSVDVGKSWSWAAIRGISFATGEVYVLDGADGKVLEAVNGSPALYWGVMPLLRSEDGGVTWRWVQVPTPPGGWQGSAGSAPVVRLDVDGALIVGKTDGANATRWFRLSRRSDEWVQSQQ